MTEEEWRACANACLMLTVLWKRATSARKLRLFACAACRLYPLLLDTPRARRALEVAEQFADGAATAGELWAAAEAAKPWASADAARQDAYQGAYQVVYAGNEGGKGVAIAELTRDVFGNPLRPPPAIDPAWLSWNGGTVAKLARSIYEERRFADVPILADALEEAGCTDAALLCHCRDPGPHVRGCWVLDRLTNRE